MDFIDIILRLLSVLTAHDGDLLKVASLEWKLPGHATPEEPTVR